MSINAPKQENFINSPKTTTSPKVTASTRNPGNSINEVAAGLSTTTGMQQRDAEKAILAALRYAARNRYTPGTRMRRGYSTTRLVCPEFCGVWNINIEGMDTLIHARRPSAYSKSMQVLTGPRLTMTVSVRFDSTPQQIVAQLFKDPQTKSIYLNKPVLADALHEVLTREDRRAVLGNMQRIIPPQ